MNVRGGLNALLFFAGLEITHNLFGDNTSSPQTTELRIGNKEGGGAAASTLMKWVHIATAKALVINGAVGLTTGNWWAMVGALVGVIDMQTTYWYAKLCGRKLDGAARDDQLVHVPVTPARRVHRYARAS